MNDLPETLDDGACRHLTGMRMPAVALRGTVGGLVDLGRLASSWTVLYCYPRTSRPDEPSPRDWDKIPGARGCTAQACGFRDQYQHLIDLGAVAFGISSQTTAYQREVVARLHLPFEMLSDEAFALTDALGLPTFMVNGERLIRRLTLIVRAGVIETVFYPVFPPDRSATQVIAWLACRRTV